MDQARDCTIRPETYAYVIFHWCHESFYVQTNENTSVRLWFLQNVLMVSSQVQLSSPRRRMAARAHQIKCQVRLDCESLLLKSWWDLVLWAHPSSCRFVPSGVAGLLLEPQVYHRAHTLTSISLNMHDLGLKMWIWYRKDCEATALFTRLLKEQYVYHK